jgi:hypothetical protein
LLYAYSGIRYDAIEKTLYLRPAIKRDFSSFFSAENGYGLAGIKNGKPFVKVVSGAIAIDSIVVSR